MGSHRTEYWTLAAIGDEPLGKQTKCHLTMRSILLSLLISLVTYSLAADRPTTALANGLGVTPPDLPSSTNLVPDGSSCSSPVEFDNQWSNGYRLVCQDNLYVLMVDLTNPAVQVEVKALTTGTEYVSSPSFVDGNTIAAINGDYQWCSSGDICSQSLTISNGSAPATYTNLGHLCRDANLRREIGWSRDGRVVVDWWYRFVGDSQARSWCGTIAGMGGGLEQYSHNLIGGGPQFTFDGVFRWDCQYGMDANHDCVDSYGDVGINGEHFGVGHWWNRYQSAIGYSTDGTVLVLAESNYQMHTMQRVHDLMVQRLGAYGKSLKNAFKLDGGSKAGFWYYNHTYDSTPNVPVPNVIRIQRTNSTCYAVATNVSPSGGGTIGANPASNCAQGKYTPGSAVQLTATANAGYRFGSWSGCDSTSNNVCSVTLNTNRSVTANFLPLPRAFSKTGPPNGATVLFPSATLSWASSSEATSYDYCYDTLNNSACDASWASTTATTADRSGLTRGLSYYWQVRARNATATKDANDGSWWSFVVFNGEVKSYFFPSIGK